MASIEVGHRMDATEQDWRCNGFAEPDSLSKTKETELETKQNSEPEKKESLKNDKIHDQPKMEDFKNMLDIEVIEDPKSRMESNKYVLVATLQHEDVLLKKVKVMKWFPWKHSHNDVKTEGVKTHHGIQVKRPQDVQNKS